MTDAIEKAKSDFVRAKKAICSALAATPDDRVNWSPSPSARTPLQQVAHAAGAVKNMNETWDGHPFSTGTTEEADRDFREWERQFTTREEVLSLLERNSNEYLAWLDTLTPERLSSMVELPFKLGAVPVAVGITFTPEHLRWHTAQIHYIQTIYGDHEWRMK